VFGAANTDRVCLVALIQGFSCDVVAGCGGRDMRYCRKREIERRVRQGCLYVLRTFIRHFLHCWQPRRDLRCEAREGIERRDQLSDTLFAVAFAARKSSTRAQVSEASGFGANVVLHSRHPHSAYSVLVQVLDMYFRIRRIRTHEAGSSTRLRAQPPDTEELQMPHCPSAVWSLELAEMQKPVIAETNQISYFETNELHFRLRPIQWTEIRSSPCEAWRR
jgi:hypothetical protein